MYLLMILVFALGYIVIALEHPLKIDKAATALITGVACWVILAFGKDSILLGDSSIEFVNEQVLFHLGEIAQILFFLLGAMTIVEIIDTHNGFEIITSKITTQNRVKLLWIVGIFTFFFSAVLDNLTTAIIMATLLKKLLHKKEDLWFFAGIVVIAANAGGAWSPIGDVTTIMLWIGGQVTAYNIIVKTFIPSVTCLLVPLIAVSYMMKGNIEEKATVHQNIRKLHISPFEQKFIFVFGVLCLLFVPVFKSVTHLPPFLGMLFSLGTLWVVTEILHIKNHEEKLPELTVSGIIRKVDTPSVMFFLGVLLAVSSLQTAGHLSQMAIILDETFGNLYIINGIIGLASSIVDNVPLVAGSMGMYPLEMFPQDHTFWELLAYCAGTGGSVLIIGSAAGVAIMGILRIDFIWYLKKISLLALLGYLSGFIVYYLMN